MLYEVITRLPRRQRLEMRDREERVLIGGEPVIDVVLHEAREGAPLRQIAPQEAELVHLCEGLRHPPPAAADVPTPDLAVGTDAADNCGAPVVSHVSDGAEGNRCPETITRTYNNKTCS